jgi:hypothetical protein
VEFLSIIETPCREKCNSREGTLGSTDIQQPAHPKREGGRDWRLFGCQIFAIVIAAELPHGLDEGHLVDLFQRGQAEPDFIQG